jgi:hypothetical protein
VVQDLCWSPTMVVTGMTRNYCGVETREGWSGQLAAKRTARALTCDRRLGQGDEGEDGVG